MARKKEWFGGLKDWTQRHRGAIIYSILVLALLGALAGWALLPDQVSITPNDLEANLRPKNSLLAIHFGITALMAGLFWRWPRELAYLVGAVLGLLLTFGLLSANLGV